MHNSIEYISYNEALDFLNKESDELEMKIRYCTDENERKNIALTERTRESRREYLLPFSIALDNKRFEIREKYNLQKSFYLN